MVSLEKAVKRLTFFLIAILFSACSFYHRSDSELLWQQVGSTSGANRDPEIERTSRALHHYLVGQLAFVNEDFPRAIAHLKEASELSDEKTTALHLRLAELYLREGSLDSALMESKKALEADPENASILLLQAGILESLERSDQSEPLYLKLIDKNPRMSNAYVFLANLYLRQDRLEEATLILKKLIKQAPKDAVGYYYLGRVYERQSEYGKAERELEKAVELAPDQAALTLDLLRILLKQRKFTRAKQYCHKLLEHDEGNVLARQILSDMLIGENKLDEALEQLKAMEAAEEDPTDIRYKMALIYLEKQEYQEAARELNLVLAQDPENANAHYYLASAYAATGQRLKAIEQALNIKAGQVMFVQSRVLAALLLRQEQEVERAEELLREALLEKPDNQQLRTSLVLLLREQRKFDQAEQELKGALEQNPDDEVLLFNYALVTHELEKEDRAMELMEKVVEINPQNVDALNFVAYSLAEQGGNLERAQDLIEQALKIKPDDAYFIDTLGWIYYQKKEFQEAKKTLARAVQIVDDNIVILEHYADTLLKLGKRADAVDIYSRALSFSAKASGREDQEAISRIKEKLRDLVDSDPVINGRN